MAGVERSTRNLRDPTERPDIRAGCPIDGRWESITIIRLRRESEGAIVAWKRGNSRGAKDPCRIDVFVRRTEPRLGTPTTDNVLRAETEGWDTGQADLDCRSDALYRGVVCGLCMPVSETIR